MIWLVVSEPVSEISFEVGIYNVELFVGEAEKRTEKHFEIRTKINIPCMIVIPYNCILISKLRE